MVHLMDLPAHQLADLISTNRTTPTQAVQAALERIAERNPSLNAFVYVCAERALAEAREWTEKQQRGEKLPIFAGLPIGVKDLEDVAGLPTSFGVKPYINNIAKEDSVQVARLRKAGCIVVGKTNTPAFGAVAFTRNLAFGITRNPFDPSRTPGGSSGGSAAAVAARMVPIATGADGGGSIRIPAAFSGCFGLKATFGRIPETEDAMFEMQKWVDCVHYGPLTRSVLDAAIYLDVTSGFHPKDPKSLPPPPTAYAPLLKTPSSGLPSRPLRIAYSPTLSLTPTVSPPLVPVLTKALSAISSLGHILSYPDIALPEPGMTWALSMGVQLLATVEESLKGKEGEIERGLVAGWKHLKGVKMVEMGDVGRRLKALNTAITTQVFPADEDQGYDILLTPAMPCEPFSADGKEPQEIGGHMIGPLDLYGPMIVFNWSGHPACSVRAGLTASGLPVGLQIVARKFREDLVLGLAAQFEEATHCFEDWPSVETMIRAVPPKL